MYFSHLPNAGLIPIQFQENECIYRPGQPIHFGKHGGSHFSQISFFCGMHPECNDFESEAALKR